MSSTYLSDITIFDRNYPMKKGTFRKDSVTYYFKQNMTQFYAFYRPKSFLYVMKITNDFNGYN